MPKASRRWECAARILAHSFAGSSTITAVSFARPISRRSNAGTCASGGSRRSTLSPVLSIPTLSPRVKWHIHRRAVALPSQLQSAAIRPLLPWDLGFPGGKRATDIVGNLLGKRCVGVNRPTTEIERLDVASQAGKARFRQRDLAPPEPCHGGELSRFEFDRGEARRHGLIEPRSEERRVGKEGKAREAGEGVE